MTIPRYARLAAKLFQRERASLQPTALPAAGARDEAVAALERALVARGRRQRLRRSAYASLGLAAAVGLAWLARASLPQPASSEHATTPPAAERSPAVVVHMFGSGARISGAGARGNQLGPGGRVHALPNGRVLLAFATGTRVSLEPGGDLTLVENGAAQVLALDSGALRADVMKLAPGRRFLVHTADTEVEVRGTSFRVSTAAGAVSCGTHAPTRVEVFEGVVTVRNAGVEHRIERGGEWQAACPPSVAAAPTSAPVLAPAAARPNTESGVHSGANAPVSLRTHAARSLTTRSELTEQNDAFAAAVSAQRAGDLARAVRGFDGLLARFPDGPLAESATVQRLKITRQFDQARARELARAYLERYPTGFAREQALAVLAESP